MSKFNELLGKTLTSVDGLTKGSELVNFVTSEGIKYQMYHDQDCCEFVYINDVCGDVDDLIGSEILSAEESISDASDDVSESGTWTFYKLATIKGSVTIRWLGQSNGYYSESVTFEKTKVA